MDLLEAESTDKLDCLIWAVERLVQRVLDTDDLLREASAVAKRIEEWRGTFHVEHPQLPLPVNMSGSQYSQTQGTHGESTESPGSSRQCYDHIREHREARGEGPPVAPHPPGPARPSGSWKVYQDLRKAQARARAQTRRGRFRGRARRRR